MKPDPRHAALEQIHALMQAYELTTADVERAFPTATAGSGETAASPRSLLLITVLSYIGGAFVFSGIAIFVATQWGGMNSLARVVITLGSGLVLFVLSLAALRDVRFVMAAVPLMLAAAALEPVGLLVALQEFAGGGDEQVAAMTVAAAVAAQFLLAFVSYRATTMVLISLFFGSASWGLGLDLLAFDWEVVALTLGVAWLLFGLQFHRGSRSGISPLLFFFGCWGFLWGLFELVQGGVFELMFLFAACGMTVLGVWARSRALNFASTVAVLVYTAYFTSRYFAGSVGWPVALILLGLLMIGISALALRIDRKYLRTA
jgi:hypothetical protein